MELKTMVTSASVYIFNYVLLMLRVHSPLPDGEGYTALLLNSTKHALSAGDESVEGAVRLCAAMLHDELREEPASLSEPFQHVAQCASAAFGAAQATFRQVTGELVTRLYGFDWYGESGVVTQMVVIAITDIVLLVLFSEVLTLCRVVAMRALARFKRAQRSINALYEPPVWRFADRYAHMLKMAAVVLVFAPAAPILYFIGGTSLLLSAAVQKFMLIKVYARPSALDDDLAKRSRVFLQALLFLHVTMAPIFYAERNHAVERAKAYAACSQRASGEERGLIDGLFGGGAPDCEAAAAAAASDDLGEMTPFFYAFGVLLCYLVFGRLLQALFFSRDEESEESGAGGRRFQEALDLNSVDEYVCPAVGQRKGGVDTEPTLRSPRARTLQRRPSLTRAGTARRLSAAAALSPRGESTRILLPQ
mmetsp:Transcript_19510/g.64493  ORF Transcript_19510/g.64493 Transcript_19510/m.64493 type:complete len:421 (+) Transcript_19510:216-1478(+)